MAELMLSEVSKALRLALKNAFRLTGAPAAEPELDEDVELDSAWNVIVHNDSVNLMSYVVKVFMKVLGFPKELAEKHMLEVHHKGRSIVWTGEREKAELYVQQLHSYLLLATLEKSV
jgi:ATP-dependent Clp protease adaptor protein ClpS